ncbi:FtsB family cell division protein [Trichlorobacter ammonificans]|uniref:Cell division protein FtsB n=1 Tax=Trichlorobacter ammonificans TaxID=2916410 RepID=A0ABM9D914_9BACT|nr:septum formation initiator family protein [Trichlorobacter ammonificans]CAH2030863.1 Cell division protein FtsB [Trichlorobacter ammonificans]
MQKSGMKRRLYLILAGCLSFILFFTVFGERGLLRINDLKRELRQVEEKSAELQTANEKLRQEIALLHGDRSHVERIARKELGLVKPDEVVYRFPSAASR